MNSMVKNTQDYSACTQSKKAQLAISCTIKQIKAALLLHPFVCLVGLFTFCTTKSLSKHIQ